eukprot:TRINITY_DN8741_c0_g2_i1.p1 TRINITY_DN8741_c0_g2~~TRINITY_DN8741_c0_g2_i1.p1  ORF type:complete len:326 (-),score=57.57 TRINITY_DN8741_c0_g2_i1:923-1900(-)
MLPTSIHDPPKKTRQYSNLFLCFFLGVFVLFCLTFSVLYWIDIPENQLEWLRGKKLPKSVEHKKDVEFRDEIPHVILSESVYSVKIKNAVGYDPVDEDEENKMRRETVKQAFLHAYTGYKDRCMGEGELKPRSGGCHNWMGEKMGLSVIDSLDTMLVMGLDDLYKESRDWIEKNLDFDKPVSVSVFEITIRCLGGLLSAYHLTKDQLLLDKARDLANHLLPAFRGRKFPAPMINLRSGDIRSHGWSTSSILAEVGSLQLEFTYLSHVTGNPIYAQKVLSVYSQILKNLPPDYLLPVKIHGAYVSLAPSLQGLLVIVIMNICLSIG